MPKVPTPKPKVKPEKFKLRGGTDYSKILARKDLPNEAGLAVKGIGVTEAKTESPEFSKHLLQRAGGLEKAAGVFNPTYTGVEAGRAATAGHAESEFGPLLQTVNKDTVELSKMIDAAFARNPDPRVLEYGGKFKIPGSGRRKGSVLGLATVARKYGQNTREGMLSGPTTLYEPGYRDSANSPPMIQELPSRVSGLLAEIAGRGVSQPGELSKAIKTTLVQLGADDALASQVGAAYEWNLFDTYWTNISHMQMHPMTGPFGGVYVGSRRQPLGKDFNVMPMEQSASKSKMASFFRKAPGVTSDYMGGFARRTERGSKALLTTEPGVPVTEAIPGLATAASTGEIQRASLAANEDILVSGFVTRKLTELSEGSAGAQKASFQWRKLVVNQADPAVVKKIEDALEAQLSALDEAQVPRLLRPDGKPNPQARVPVMLNGVSVLDDYFATTNPRHYLSAEEMATATGPAGIGEVVKNAGGYALAIKYRGYASTLFDLPSLESGFPKYKPNVVQALPSWAQDPRAVIRSRQVERAPGDFFREQGDVISRAGPSREEILAAATESGVTTQTARLVRNVQESGNPPYADVTLLKLGEALRQLEDGGRPLDEVTRRTIAGRIIQTMKEKPQYAPLLELLPDKSHKQSNANVTFVKSWITNVLAGPGAKKFSSTLGLPSWKETDRARQLVVSGAAMPKVLAEPAAAEAASPFDIAKFTGQPYHGAVVPGPVVPVQLGETQGTIFNKPSIAEPPKKKNKTYLQLGKKESKRASYEDLFNPNPSGSPPEPYSPSTFQEKAEAAEFVRKRDEGKRSIFENLMKSGVSGRTL